MTTLKSNSKERTVSPATGVIPFADNVEFLEAKQKEISFLVKSVNLRHQMERWKSPVEQAPPSLPDCWYSSAEEKRKEEKKENEDSEKSAEELKALQKECLNGFLSLRRENQIRLEASAKTDIPFRNLADRCSLSSFEQDALWLLFFKATSPDFRALWEETGSTNYGRENGAEIYVGNILRILFPNSLRKQLEARKSFSIESPLLTHNLIEFKYDLDSSPSILAVEVEMPQRVVGWISSDNNRYSTDTPFVVETPSVSLSQVVLPLHVIDRVLTLINSYDETIQLRTRLGLDECIGYGRAVSILEYGPPGTGKTLLAQAISNETGRPLISFGSSVDSSSYLPIPPLRRRYTGRNEEKSIARLFREAQIRDGIVFIDECDDLCNPDSDTIKPIMMALEKTDAIVIMATNKPDKLDPALDRRFTIKIPFEIPPTGLRRKIWEVHLPERVPMADDVDLDHLAVSFPFAGGYIKNAVLTAVSMALARGGGNNFILTQHDLEAAARLQERHVGGAALYRTIRYPRFGLEGCLMEEKDRRYLGNLAKTAANFRDVALRLLPNGNGVGGSRGLNILLYGESFELSFQAAEGLAGELGIPMDVIPLHRLISTANCRQDNQKGYSEFAINDLFRFSVGNGHLLVFTDERDIIANLADERDDSITREFFDQMRDFEGVVVVISASRAIRLPSWARVFHRTAKLQIPRGRVLKKHWDLAVNGSLTGGANLAKVVERHPLSPEQVKEAVHRACLLLAGKDSGGGFDKTVLEEAIKEVVTVRGPSGPLFGRNDNHVQ